MKPTNNSEPSKTNGNNGAKKREKELDEASKESFPASDAPAWISHDTPPKKPKDQN